MQLSVHLPSSLLATAALALVSLPTSAPTQAQGAAQLQDPSQAQNTAQGVFPAERPSQDQRLFRSARTADSRVEWKPDPDPVLRADRVKEVVTRMRVALGLWPHCSAGLEHVEVGVVDQGDHVILKRSVMTNWFYFSAANVYAPKHIWEGSSLSLAPIVLVPCGDWDGGRLRLRSEEEANALIESGEEQELANARRPYQALATQLARMGCVVLVYDVTGAGESTELKPGDFTGLEREGRLQSLLGWRVWEAFNVLNQAWNIPGVDQRRVAMIGNGPGAQISLLLALQEPRIKTVLALDYLSERSQVQSLAETSPHLRVGTSNVEYAAALAPRGLYAAATGQEACANQARFAAALEEQWALLDSSDTLELACLPEAAAPLNLQAREGVYEFLNRNLSLGLDSPVAELPINPLPTRDLAVHGVGDRVRHKSERLGPDCMALYSKVTDDSLDLLIHEETPYRVSIFKTWMGAALRVLMNTGLPTESEVSSRLAGYERRDDRALMRLALGRAGSGEEVPAILIVPDRWNKTVVVGVSGGGKQDFFGAGRPSSLSDAARVVDQGAAFLALDPLLTGEYLNGASDSNAPALPVDRRRDQESVSFTLDYNRSLIAERVHDVLTAIGFARAMSGVERVHLVGTGEAGPWAILARALAGEEVVERTAAQWSWEFADIPSTRDANFLPGGVRYGDLAYYASLIAPSELVIVSGPGQGPVGIPEHVIRTYNSLGKKELVRSAGSTEFPAVIDWLAR